MPLGPALKTKALATGYVLSEADENWAAERAFRLQESAGRNRHGASRNKSYQQDLNLHIQGQRGEIAAARVLGVTANFYPDTFHGKNSPPDIGTRGEVRTRSKQWHDLIVRKDDPDNRYYVLVIGTEVRGTPLNVIGSIEGEYAKASCFLLDPSGDGQAYFVPKECLTRTLSDMQEPF